MMLSRNAGQLENLGVSYPFPETSQGLTQLSWSGNILKTMRRRAMEAGEGATRLIAVTDRHFAPAVDAALAASNQSTVLLSGEFITQCATSSTLKYLQDLSKNHDVSIIACVRDVYDHALSSWKQTVKGDGYRRTIEHFTNSTLDSDRSNLQRLKYISQTGANLQIVNYDHHKNNLTAKMLQIVGIDPNAAGLEFDNDRIINRSISYWQAKLIVALSELTGSSHLSVMVLKEYQNSPDHRADPIRTDLDTLIIERLAPEIAWVNGYLPETERLRDKVRSDSAIEVPTFSDADLRQLLTVIGVYINSIELPNVISPSLLAAGLPADFNPLEYLLLHPELVLAKVNAAEHYLKHGKAEGRRYRAG